METTGKRQSQNFGRHYPPVAVEAVIDQLPATARQGNFYSLLRQVNLIRLFYRIRRQPLTSARQANIHQATSLDAN
jgi:hypothetical protein